MGDVGGWANDLIGIVTLAALVVVVGAVGGLLWHSWNSAARPGDILQRRGMALPGLKSKHGVRDA